MTYLILTLAVSLLIGLLVLRVDLQRRAVSVAGVGKLPVLSLLDLICPAALVCAAGASILTAARSGVVPLYSPLTWVALAALGIALFLWKEGLRQIQFQRPAGIVTGEALVLLGFYTLVQLAVFHGSPYVPNLAASLRIAVAGIGGGGIVIGAIVPPFIKDFEGHRIIDRPPEQVQAIQAEYTPATPECPNPERWRMVDSQTSELEVLEFLKSVVTTVKPSLILETGTFIGHSAIKMAEGLCENGFGRIITVEYDQRLLDFIRQRMAKSSQ